MPALTASADNEQALSSKKAYCVEVTESKVYVRVLIGPVTGLLSLIVETLGKETVELAGISVEMDMVVIALVMSIVEVSSMITLVPCTFS